MRIMIADVDVNCDSSTIEMIIPLSERQINRKKVLEAGAFGAHPFT